jgi:hypothetical protein
LDSFINDQPVPVKAKQKIIAAAMVLAAINWPWFDGLMVGDAAYNQIAPR